MGLVGLLLGKDLLYYMSFHIGKTEGPSLEVEGELFVVEPQEVQHSGVYIVYRDLALQCRKSNFIGESPAGPFLYAPSGHPHGKGVPVVVPALIGHFLALPVFL